MHAGSAVGQHKSRLMLMNTGPAGQACPSISGASIQDELSGMTVRAFKPEARNQVTELAELEKRTHAKGNVESWGQMAQET